MKIYGVLASEVVFGVFAAFWPTLAFLGVGLLLLAGTQFSNLWIAPFLIPVQIFWWMYVVKPLIAEGKALQDLEVLYRKWAKEAEVKDAD
jgi:hypothetical protein